MFFIVSVFNKEKKNICSNKTNKKKKPLFKQEKQKKKTLLNFVMVQ